MKRVLVGLIVLAAAVAGVMRFLEVPLQFPALTSQADTPISGLQSEKTTTHAQSKAAAVIRTVASPEKATKYAEAKNHIVRAKRLLADVVREDPGSDDAYYARLQAAALENIFANDVPVAPVELTDAIYWRVLRLQNTDAYTKVTVEVENTSPNESQCFYIFDQSPLVLVADKKVYAMKKNAIERPANVQQCYGDGRWALQPTQAITLDLYFDTLDPGTINGRLKYEGNQSREKPALFSLVNINQAPGH